MAYTPPTLTGYNTNPPSDDGTQADQNKVSWVKHTGKLTDPLKQYADDINAETEATFAEVTTPPGVVVDYAGETAPDGWVLCDGASYNSSTDPTFTDLFGVLGVRYGGTGAADFNVPDYRGKFRRGRDAGAGNDPDAASRTDRGDGTTGDAVGTQQDFALEDHVHKVSFAAEGSTGGDVLEPNTGGANTGEVNDTSSNVSSETRPINVYTNVIIKK